MKIGVISDTHGLLRPEAVRALTGVEQIIHAGDIGSADVLAGLARLAPVTAVVGNIDCQQPWASGIPERCQFDLDGWRILLLHDRAQVGGGAGSEAVDLVISGHSHRPDWQLADWQHSDGPAWLNPGSAGRRRFSLPVCLALVELATTGIEVKIVELVVH